MKTKLIPGKKCPDLGYNIYYFIDEIKIHTLYYSRKKKKWSIDDNKGYYYDAAERAIDYIKRKETIDVLLVYENGEKGILTTEKNPPFKEIIMPVLMEIPRLKPIEDNEPIKVEYPAFGSKTFRMKEDRVFYEV